MNFDKIKENQLKITVNKNLDISFLFEGDFATYVYIGDYEYPTSTEHLDALYVGVGDKIISIKALTHEANLFWENITKEDERDGKDYASTIAALCKAERYI